MIVIDYLLEEKEIIFHDCVIDYLEEKERIFLDCVIG
jgi:hypothetical protein